MPDEMNLESVEAALAQPQNMAVADALAPKRADLAAPGAPSPAGALDALVPKPAQTPQAPRATPTQPQFQNALGIMRQALATARSGGADALHAAKSGAIARLVGSLRQSAPLAAPAASVAPASPPPAVKMISPKGGGRAVPAYEYGGNTILLGDDIDINDSAAVQRRMAETSDLIDMINSAYEED